MAKKGNKAKAREARDASKAEAAREKGRSEVPPAADATSATTSAQEKTDESVPLEEPAPTPAAPGEGPVGIGQGESVQDMPAPEEPAPEKVAPQSEDAPTRSEPDRATFNWKAPPQMTAEEREQDLINQVTGLNAKLVSSYNRISDLEDDLTIAHSRILGSTTQIAELNKEREQYFNALNTGLLVEKAHVVSEMQRMMERVVDETAQRGRAESDRTRIETELEELSASLFGEANKMVAIERLERARAEARSEQLEQSLRDTERMMSEQQALMHSLQSRADPEATRAPVQAPVMPMRDVILSVNTVPFHEFTAFLAHLRQQHQQLVPYFNMRTRGIDWTRMEQTTMPALGNISSPGNSLVLSASTIPVRHRDYPHLPASAEQLVQIQSHTSLPFIRRSLDEDTEPCLRLSAAPGLNWLTRRQTNAALLEGNLIIEPLFAGGKVPNEAALRDEHAMHPPVHCTLCGTAMLNVGYVAPEPSRSKSESGFEGRRSLPSLFQSFRRGSGIDAHEEIFVHADAPKVPPSQLPIPTHYFRISDNASSRYMLCPHHCLHRLRSVCSFWTFVRTLERAIVLEGKSMPDIPGISHKSIEDESDDGFEEASEGEHSADATESRDVQQEGESMKAEEKKEEQTEEDNAEEKAEQTEEDNEESKEEAKEEEEEGVEENVEEPPARQPAPALPPRPAPPRTSFPLHCTRANLSWEENVWAEVMRLKETMFKARCALDLDQFEGV